MDGVREDFERSYWMLVEDSLLLLEASETSFQNDFANSLARAALLNTLVLPEVVANCCIDDLGLESSVYREIDRLSVVAKFDFYLRTKFRKRSLHRGNRYVQSLGELKKLRDDYVHPKTRKVFWVGPGDGVQTADRPQTPLLGIAKNPRDWWHEDAVLAMRAVHEFLAYFFIDCCRYSKSVVASILAAESEVPERGVYYVPYLPTRLRQDLLRWRVSLGYIKHGWL